MAKSDSSERTYLGPGNSFRSSQDAKPIKPGEKVKLTEDQYRQLTDLGHSFDPPWSETGAQAGPKPAPHEVPDLQPDAKVEPAITAVPDGTEQEVVIPA